MLGGSLLPKIDRLLLAYTLIYHILQSHWSPLMSNPSSPPAPPAPPDAELDMLKQEYFFLQNTIEDYNKQIWAIKALGIAGTGAAIALTVQLKLRAIPLIGCAIPMFFWILESQWKHFQRGFYPRVLEIEAIFATEYKLRSPSIYTGWSRSFKRNLNPTRKGFLWDGLLNRSVFLSYLLEIVFLFVLAAIAPYVLK